MTIALTDSQIDVIALKRLATGKRPQYYNASQGRRVEISEDFEAFLILQGRAQNKQTLNWLQVARDLAINDADRDSLVNDFLTNDRADAEASLKELSPISDKFNEFKDSFRLQGFEQVSEIGSLLSDLQRPMEEVISLVNRHKHRIVYNHVANETLRRRGLTVEQQQQLNSWFEPLTAY